MGEPDHLPEDCDTDGRETAEDRRWRLIADVTVFQGKLLLDGLRDLVLSPVSVGAALIGIATSRNDPGQYFYRLMRWGRWSDRAINLFHAKGAPKEDPADPDDPAQGANIDWLADELERALIERYAQSSLARAAKDSIDKGIDRVNEVPAIDRERLRAAARRILGGLERTGLRRAGDGSKSAVAHVSAEAAGTRNE